MGREAPRRPRGLDRGRLGRVEPGGHRPREWRTGAIVAEQRRCGSCPGQITGERSFHERTAICLGSMIRVAAGAVSVANDSDAVDVRAAPSCPNRSRHERKRAAGGRNRLVRSRQERRSAVCSPGAQILHGRRGWPGGICAGGEDGPVACPGPGLPGSATPARPGSWPPRAGRTRETRGTQSFLPGSSRAAVTGPDRCVPRNEGGGWAPIRRWRAGNMARDAIAVCATDRSPFAARLHSRK